MKFDILDIITNIVTKSNYRDCIDQIWNLKFEISSPI